jgi:hypothetical protein
MKSVSRRLLPVGPITFPLCLPFSSQPDLQPEKKSRLNLIQDFRFAILADYRL